jgi:hypothetical protein
MLDNQYLFASVLLVAAGSDLHCREPNRPQDVVANMKGAVVIAKPYHASWPIGFY